MNIGVMTAMQTAVRVSTQIMLDEAEKKRMEKEERKKKEEIISKQK